VAARREVAADNLANEIIAPSLGRGFRLAHLTSLQRWRHRVLRGQGFPAPLSVKRVAFAKPRSALASYVRSWINRGAEGQAPAGSPRDAMGQGIR
jgi:hypothetical protein